MKKIEDDTRRRIAEFLPKAIVSALKSYSEFSKQEPPDKPKEFTAHHNACKVAIAHIELLIKLARWADLPDPAIEDETERAMFNALMAKAQDEVDEYKSNGNEGDECE